uniref:Uncharacterized protein n=1 Tax=Spironucleus salmonicida TaxID=348837 RepID=V6LC85_9EUKA|eukprot:EST42115.1 hypothetical protein SS50377_18424 [Spironucleus salmonicida]
MDKSLRTSQLGQASKPVQPLPNSQISNSQIQLFEQFQHEKITKTRLEKQLRSSKLQIPVSINSDIQNRMVNLWDALEVSVKERHYAYTVLRESQEQALNYINKMRQILFHRRRFEELTSRREQIAEQLRVMLQQGKGSKKDLLTNAIQVRMMTLELFTIFNSARKYVKKPIDLPSLNVLNYSFPKRLLGESVFSRENLIVAMCVVRFFGKSSYNSVKSQVNQIFDQLIIDGSNENEVSFSFMIGQQLLNSSIPLQFHQFLVQTFQDLYDVNLDQYLPRNLIKLDLVKNIMKQENQAYSEYIKKVTTIQNQDLDICVVPIKDDILFDPNISYIDGWSIEEINKINLTFKHTLSKKFSPQRLLQDMRNSKLNITKTQVQNVNKQKIQATLQLQEDLLPFEEIEPEIMQQPQIFTCQMAKPAKIEAAFTEEAFDEEPAMPAKIEAAFTEEAFDEEPAMPAKIEAAFDEEAFDEEPAMPAKIEAAFTEEAFDEEPAMPAKIEAAFDEEAFDEEPAMPVTVDAALEEIIVQSHTDNRLGLNNVSYHFDQEFEANGFED